MKNHPNKIPFEYSKINEYIYIGTNQCCQMHFKKGLLAKGIKADISIEKEKIDSPLGVDYFLWLPVSDFKAPSQKQIKIGADVIKECVDNKIKVYVHCKRGHGRSPAMVAAYFIQEGMKMNDAIKKIKAKRKSIHLQKSQIAALKKFEKRVNQ